ncbi:uncharacterized protein KY384_003440 [Bacidia gigantensis]|uniref:uncharacterized protein n=1 Tax=Bacidia gigantensis TaxID=2732470 RepID=UPI001D03B2A8|nr:uncharacterized protein KY384_003440 [Bacidia gigantensis]KAG8531804.1 hypothetical protein KY384_003440 [Bacidia gigantensis]
MPPPSALIGQPPLTDSDYWIVRSFLLNLGMLDKMDPKNGFPSPVKRPAPGEHHQSLQGKFIASIVVCMAFMLIPTIVRLALRCRTANMRLGWDDIFVVLGCFFGLSFQILNIFRVALGKSGAHMYDLTYWNLYINLAVGGGSALIIWFWCIVAVKMSILFFYMRLNGFASRKWKIVLWTLFAAMVAYIVSATLVVALHCDHPRSFFDLRYKGHLEKEPKCLDLPKVVVGLNVIEILFDASLMVVPVVMLWKVQMKWTTKLRVYIAGMVGCLNIAIAVGRTLMNFSQQKAVDFSWYSYTATQWAQAELTLGVITASLPVLSNLITIALRSLSHRRNKDQLDRAAAKYRGYVFNQDAARKNRRATHPLDYSDTVDGEFEISRTTTRSSNTDVSAFARGGLSEKGPDGLHVVEIGEASSSAGSSS